MPSKLAWMTLAMLDLPERGAPLRTTIEPGLAEPIMPATVVVAGIPPVEVCRRDEQTKNPS